MGNDKCDDVSKTALVSYCEYCPLAVIHLTLDGTDSSEARSAEEIEYEE